MAPRETRIQELEVLLTLKTRNSSTDLSIRLTKSVLQFQTKVVHFQVISKCLDRSKEQDMVVLDNLSTSKSQLLKAIQTMPRQPPIKSLMKSCCDCPKTRNPTSNTHLLNTSKSYLIQFMLHEINLLKCSNPIPWVAFL